MDNVWSHRFRNVYSLSKSNDLIPTGIPTLDNIIGGYPCGSVVLILEDELRTYSQVFLKCFLAEGAACNNELFIGSCDLNPEKILQNLPPCIEKKEETSECNSEELKIAWRYQNVGPVRSTPEGKKNVCFSHDFDVSNKISTEEIQKLNVHYWMGNKSDSINLLFNEIQDIVISNGYTFDSKSDQYSVLRISLHSFASPFWFLNAREIYLFLYKMRAIVHNSRSVLLFSMSTQLYNQHVIERCAHLSDLTISLTSLSNSSNPLYSEYNGLIKLIKLSSINSLAPQVPEDVDWVFKLKRKKIVIEKLHLPPEAPDTSQKDEAGIERTKPNCQFQF